jgi:signal transduction histidine kinase
MSDDPAKDRYPGAMPCGDSQEGAVSGKETEGSRARWAFLAEASRLLADSLDYETTMETVAALALPLLGSWSIVDLSEPDGSVRRLTIVHPNPDEQEIARELKAGWPPHREDPLGVSVVARTGRSNLVSEVTEELLERVARNDENLRHLGALGMKSLVTVPMRARGRILGAITFISSAESRPFTSGDVSLAEDLAERCALAIDNARLHRAARELADAERARVQAEAANQLKTEFLATVSHELRTPLNVIAGYLELLAMELAGPLTGLQRHYIERIRAGEEQLLRIVEDMLNFVRLYEKEIEYDLVDVPLQRVVRDVSEPYRQGLEEKGLTLELRCDSPIRAHADPAKVWQILMNLLSNARKFTESGGRITVECTEEAGQAVIRVVDTGCGIPREKVVAVFEPFVQVDGGLTRRSQGIGLGLAISRQLARDMNGDLVLTSHGAGMGCSFTLTLPAAREAESRS